MIAMISTIIIDRLITHWHWLRWLPLPNHIITILIVALSLIISWFLIRWGFQKYLNYAKQTFTLNEYVNYLNWQKINHHIMFKSYPIQKIIITKDAIMINTNLNYHDQVETQAILKQCLEKFQHIALGQKVLLHHVYIYNQRQYPNQKPLKLWI